MGTGLFICVFVSRRATFYYIYYSINYFFCPTKIYPSIYLYIESLTTAPDANDCAYYGRAKLVVVATPRVGPAWLTVVVVEVLVLVAGVEVPATVPLLVVLVAVTAVLVVVVEVLVDGADEVATGLPLTLKLLMGTNTQLPLLSIT